MKNNTIWCYFFYYVLEEHIIKDAINKASRQVINYAINNQISEIIIGYNKRFKLNGIKNKSRKKDKKRINQNFIQIPLSKIKERIKYLCLINNIKYTEINESYTSICSFYDNEEIKKQETYQGKRITRSLFETKDKRIINTDINGALNILKNVKPKETI